MNHIIYESSTVIYLIYKKKQTKGFILDENTYLLVIILRRNVYIHLEARDKKI
jgi:hypothetical protein